jgi:hypothetical protein
VVSRLRAALAQGRREALSELADTLADEIEATDNARDRLAKIRALLATVAQLEQLDAAALRQARADARSPAAVDPGGRVRLVDELRDRRARRRA